MRNMLGVIYSRMGFDFCGPHIDGAIKNLNTFYNDTRCFQAENTTLHLKCAGCKY